MDLPLYDIIRSWYEDPKGWCYSASEAYYYLAGGKEAGLKPVRATIEVDGQEIKHWWIEGDGEIIDLTADQFDFDFPYHLGRGCGFQANIKKESKQIIDWVKYGLVD